MAGLKPLEHIYSLSNLADTTSAYDAWAKDYDADLINEEQGYVGPLLASEHVLKCLGRPTVDAKTEILDAGCGTGLVGGYLAKAGARKIDGIDISPGMLDMARRTNAYRALDVVDLSRPIPRRDQSYDVLVCVGTLTQSHVGPGALDEFARVIKPGGWIVATVLESIWKKDGFEAKVQALGEEKKVRVVSTEVEDYRRGPGVRAVMVVLQVL